MKEHADLLDESVPDKSKPTNKDWINSWEIFKGENRESENFGVFNAIQNESSCIVMSDPAYEAS